MSARGLLLAALAGAGVLAEADRAYRRGDHAGAAAGYSRALARGDSSAVLRYNLGTALLRLGRHDEARPHLEAAARGADPALRLRAAYNAAHTDLAPVAAGRVAEAERPERLERAVAHYRRVLLADPADADARWNLELAERLLRRPAGGGGGEDEDEGGVGEDGAPAAPRPQGPGAGRPLTPEEAERILAGAEQRDLQVQRERLKQDQRRIHGVRDW